MGKIFGTETQQTISEWAFSVFGPAPAPRSVLTRANCEMAELLHAIECGESREKIASGIADVIIVICRYPVQVIGCTLDLHFAVQPIDWANLMLHEARLKGSARCIRELVAALELTANQSGIDLPGAIDAKMAINRGRTCVAKGAGHGQHSPTAHDVREAETLHLASVYRAACSGSTR